MKKKKFILYFACFLLIVGALFYIRERRSRREFHAFIGLACSAQKYTEKDGIGYLTIVLETDHGTKSKAVQVKDSDLRSKLAATNVKKVIGASIVMNLPYSCIEEHHIDVGALERDAMSLLMGSNMFDDYFEVVDISTEIVHVQEN